MSNFIYNFLLFIVCFLLGLVVGKVVKSRKHKKGLIKRNSALQLLNVTVDNYHSQTNLIYIQGSVTFNLPDENQESITRFSLILYKDGEKELLADDPKFSRNISILEFQDFLQGELRRMGGDNKFLISL